MNILYEDTALVVLDKPAGLTSEEGVPAALRQRWGRPDAYVGVIQMCIRDRYRAKQKAPPTARIHPLPGLPRAQSRALSPR